MSAVLVEKYNYFDLGLISYDQAYAFQKEKVQSLLDGGISSLIVCEHPATITLGRLAKKENILAAQDILDERGVLVRAVDRGGDVTMHVPGQVVVYPILDLKNYSRDLRKYMFCLEQMSIEVLKDFGVSAQRVPGKTGVWVGMRKIVSIGVGVKKWVSFHGLSININPDLEEFSVINSCDLNALLTSVKELKKEIIDIQKAKQRIQRCFEKEFNVEVFNE